MIVLALFLLLIILLLIPLRLRISADGTEAVLLRIFYWKIPLKRLRVIIRMRSGVVPYVYLENKKVCTRIFPKKSKRNHRRVPLLHAVLKAYRAEKLHINIVIGTEDAAATAYSVGIMRNVIRLLLPKLRLKSLQNVKISVVPHFDGLYFSVAGECIISAVPANIIRKVIIRKADK